MNFFKKSKDTKTQTEIEYLKKEIYDLKDIVHFLSTHDKDDIQITYHFDRNCYDDIYIAKYIYNGELKSAQLPFYICKVEVTKNDKDSFVIKMSSTLTNILLYYKVNKKDGIYIDVTEFFEKRKHDT